jgi:hypothetical protein
LPIQSTGSKFAAGDEPQYRIEQAVFPIVNKTEQIETTTKKRRTAKRNSAERKLTPAVRWLISQGQQQAQPGLTRKNHQVKVNGVEPGERINTSIASQ